MMPARIFLIGLLFLMGSAQAGDLSLNKSFRVVSNLGEPYRYVFVDGREATLKMVYHDSPILDEALVIADNSCSNRQGMSCNLRFQYRHYWLGMVWTKNLDPQAVGRVVTYRGATDSGEFTAMKIDSVTSAGMDPLKTTLPGNKLPPIELNCDDFSWLPSGAKNAPSTLRIDRWDLEDNDTNPETGAQENRTVGGAWALNFSQISPQTLRLQSIGGINGILSTVDMVMITAGQNLTVRQANGGVCQVGILNPSLAQLMAGDDQLTLLNPKIDNGGLTTLPDYIVGRDNMLRLPDVRNYLKVWNSKYEMNFL